MQIKKQSHVTQAGHQATHSIDLQSFKITNSIHQSTTKNIFLYNIDAQAVKIGIQESME